MTYSLVVLSAIYMSIISQFTSLFKPFKLQPHISNCLLDTLRGSISKYSHTVGLGLQHLNYLGAGIQYSP